MNVAEARTLKPGDRVRWRANGKDFGVVAENHPGHTIIDWDDGVSARFNHSEMGAIHKVEQVRS